MKMRNEENTMVRFMAMVLPAVVGVCFLEHLEKKEYTIFAFLKTLARYMFWINGITLLICNFILKIENSVYESFGSNPFLLHYMEISLFFALILPIISYRLRPLISITIKKKNE